MTHDEHIQRAQSWDPAFPSTVKIIHENTGHQNTFNYEGLTKREYFAGSALAGLCYDIIELQAAPDKLAKCAVAYADALIAELKKEDADA